MNNLIDIDTLINSEAELALFLIDLGILSALEKNNSKLVSKIQFQRLRTLVEEGNKAPFQVQLIPMYFELSLGGNISLTKSTDEEIKQKGFEVLIQLLPSYLESLPNKLLPNKSGSSLNYKGSPYQIKTKNAEISHKLEEHFNNFYNTLDRKHMALARSANYQGSKASFTPAICAIIETHTSTNCFILDLMCGAGSVSGAVSHIRPVIASDAQLFSRNLAIVQGGGMDVKTADHIISSMYPEFKSNFELLKKEIHKDIIKEDKYLNTEITEDICKEFSQWVLSYERVGNENVDLITLNKKLESYVKNNTKIPGILFTKYYANLFFGIKQTAEIDSLRTAILKLDNPLHQQWALGALTATVSYCAYNYGGHFAQPKMNISNGETIKKSQLKQIIHKRKLSVNHEFSARLLSLAKESENTLHEILDVEGPWEDALLNTKYIVGDGEVLVYLDPPYTRDEFSRYYHVLETLMHYNYPTTSGKASLPLKGTKGRFRSNFFTRNKSNVEDLLFKIILECLKLNWSCLFSYSANGLANITRVVEKLDEHTAKIEIFSSDHLHKGQGKQKSKNVVEYFILLKP